MKKRDIIIVTLSVAVAIVCIALTFWGNLKNNGVLTIDAYIGVIASLIGVCATIVVGFQIASFLELREVKKQVELVEKQRQELEELRNKTLDQERQLRDVNLKAAELIERQSQLAQNLLEQQQQQQIAMQAQPVTQVQPVPQPQAVPQGSISDIIGDIASDAENVDDDEMAENLKSWIEKS